MHPRLSCVMRLLPVAFMAASMTPNEKKTHEVVERNLLKTATSTRQTPCTPAPSPAHREGEKKKINRRRETGDGVHGPRRSPFMRLLPVAFMTSMIPNKKKTHDLSAKKDWETYAAEHPPSLFPLAERFRGGKAGVCTRVCLASCACFPLRSWRPA